MRALAATGRRRSAAAILLFCLFVVGIYSSTLFARRNFAGRDLLIYNLPIEKAVHDAYSRGRLPVWIPEISGGRPLAANPNVGAFYPVRPLLSLFSFPLAMRIFPILHWAAAGVGMLLLLRSIGASGAAAWIGAVTYAFCGPAVAEVFYPNFQPGMALLPWVVWAVSRRGSSEAGRLLTLALLLALLLLAGDVFTVGIAVLSAFLWILVEREAAVRRRETLFVAVGLLLSGLVAAPQIVASALWVPETNRAILGMKLGQSLSFSLPPLRLLELVVPFPFGPTWALDDSPIWGWPVFHLKTIGFFTTLYSGAFCVVALAASRKWQMQGARFARVLFVLAALVSVTPSLLPASAGNLPSPIPLRYPEKFAVAIVFSLAILTALAFDRFRTLPRAPRWTLVVAGLLTAAAVAAALFPERAGSVAVAVVGKPVAQIPRAPADPVAVAARQLPPALAEAGLFWVLTVVALDFLKRPGPRGTWISIALLCLIPVAANRRIARTVRSEQIVSPTAFGRFLARNDPAREFRTLGEPYYRGVSEIGMEQWLTRPEEEPETWTVYRHALMGRGTVFNLDFDVADFARLDSLRRISSVAARQPAGGSFFGNLSLRWGTRFRDQEPIPGYRPFRTNALHGWDVLGGALPDVRLVQAWREEPGPLEAARAVLGLGPGEIVLETGRRGQGSARAGKVRLLEREPDRLSIESDAPDPAWLFVLRGFWMHRTVEIDGRPVADVPAQLAFSAVRVPSGRHTVAWRERVPGWTVSRWGPVVFLLLAAALIGRERQRRKTP